METVQIVPVYLNLTTGGQPYFNVELAVAKLLADDTLFVNSRKYVSLDGTIQPETLVLFAAFSDTFGYACADSESVTYDEVEPLYKEWEKNNQWGPTIWCILKRRQLPIPPVILRMKEDGVWDKRLSDLALELNKER